MSETPVALEIPSETSDRIYKLEVHDGVAVCDCPGFTNHGHCRHVDEATKEETVTGTPTEQTEESRALTVAPQPLAVAMPTRTLPTRDELSVIASIAASVVKAAGHAVPKEMDSPYKAMAVMLAGWELGMKPMTALRHIFVVNGRTEPDAQAMMGVVRALDPTADFIFHEWTEDACKVELRRQGRTALTIEYTITDAQKSGQIGRVQGGPWAKYPRDMLAWAAVKRVCRLGAPDLINAIPSVAVEDTEGMVEAAGLLGAGETVVDVDEETGEIRDPEPAPPSDDAGWVPREMAEAGEGGQVARPSSATGSGSDLPASPPSPSPPPPTGRLKPRPETTEDAAAVDEARRSFFAAASELELATHRSLHQALRLPCNGTGNHNDSDKNACKSLEEHRNMLAMDGRGSAGAWHTLESILRGEEAAPWAKAEPEPEPEPEYVGEEAVQGALGGDSAPA